ncbi:MAG: flagellar biosynthetic protein FliO [Planctomycetota bacterium]|nr:flagellar biosynthetic protein FliO [Planctomycetota bacterium]
MANLRILLLAVMAGLGLMLVTGPGALQAAAPEAKGAAAEKADQPVAAEKPLPVGLPDRPMPKLGADDQASSRLLWQSLAAVLVILALGGIGTWAVKRLLPRITSARGNRIRLIESFHLAPQQTVHLMQVGNLNLLIGASRERLTLLADMTGDIDPPPDPAAGGVPRTRFTLPAEPSDEGGAGGKGGPST